IADRADVVMEGRDIGTVVLPDADVKIFLSASPEVRARRRVEQRGGGGYAETLREIIRRDERDSTREIAPLNPASDATIIVTDQKTLTEVISEAIHLVKERLEGRWDHG
ncbi:MAG TPA: cytidylate kinase, partial [Candidatus Acetothermia bacterium]|nr:cytidylate kinase [Candidatus Acetothermia bacterium]